MSDRPSSYLSCSSLARELDVSESTIQQFVRRGVLPAPVKMSTGCVRWRWADVEIALSSLTGPTAAASRLDPYAERAVSATAS